MYITPNIIANAKNGISMYDIIFSVSEFLSFSIFSINFLLFSYYNNDIKVEDIFLKENGEDWVQSQTFTLTNNYIKTITYDIGVLVSENTFASENFEYEIYKVNNGVKTKVGNGLVKDLTAGNTGTGHIIAGKGAGNALVLAKDESATFEMV